MVAEIQAPRKRFRIIQQGFSKIVVLSAAKYAEHNDF
jgi:hypothetical protein